MEQKVILAYDGSLENQHALLNCKELSQWKHAKVYLLSVGLYETISMGHEGSYFSELENKIEDDQRLKILNDGVEQLNKAGISATGKLLKGDAVDMLAEYAHTIGADLIMLGHQHRNNWLERWWAGSFPKALIEHSPCSVLVVIIK
ncbi:MAG: universal stress protein [Betaproteobacteria bacterium]|nr:universal stress protein [Betaproteobacteria bacterium]NBT68949.1 universal stress protein [Betaproteobacteria bacterium]